MRKEDFFARTMHTPDDPQRAERRAALREISKLLIPLHRALIEAARGDYNATVAHIASPGQFLQLLNDDPFFAWLKPLTSLIVDIDELARRDFEAPQIDDIVQRAQRLFGTSADEAFATHYVPLLQRDIDVAVGHAAVRKAIAKLSG